MVFLSFIMSVFVAIQDPIIQKFAIRIAGGYISSKTGAEVQIGRLYISPNFTIHIDHFLVKDLREHTLLGVEELRVRPIMEDIVHGEIHIGRVELNNAEANLIKYKDSTQMNLQFLIDAFTLDKKEREKPVVVDVDRVLLKKLNFQLWDQNRDDPLKTANGLMDYAHLVIDDINLDLEGLRVIGDSITGTIHHLAGKEISGFTIKYLESDLNVSQSGILLDGLRLQTSNSNLSLDLHMLYNNYQAFRTFVDSVTFDTPVYPSDILLTDLGPFTNRLYQMPDLIHFEGVMRGPVRRFSLNDLKFSFGEDTDFEGSLSIEPINFTKGQQTLNIKRMNFTYDDLANFHIPIPSQTIPIPAALKPMGHGTLTGYFDGSFKKFSTDLAVASEMGDVHATLTKHVNDLQYNVIEGNVDAECLDIGLLANASDIIGTLDLSANIIGRQPKGGDMDIDIEGEVIDVFLLGNEIDEIAFNGNLHRKCFNGKVSVDDNELGLDFKGRFDFSDPKALAGNFKADITKADLHKLNLIKNDNIATLSCSIMADVTDINNFNQAEGTLAIKNLAFTNSRGNFAMKQLNASIANDNLMQKRINLNCDFLDFTMAGKMDFTTLGTAFKQYVSSYLTIPQWTDELELFAKSGNSAEQDFIVDLNLKDPKPITQLLMPAVSVAKNTTLNGTFTSKSHSLNMTMRSKYVKVNDIKINNIECKNQSGLRRSTLKLNVEQVVLRDSTEHNPTMLSLDALNLLASLQDDNVKLHLGWDDRDVVDHNKSDLNLTFVPTPTGGRLAFDQSSLLLNDYPWTVNPNSFIAIDDGRVQISNLELLSEGQRLLVDGYAPIQQDDTLAVSLDQFDLGSLSFLLTGLGFDINGLISGNATLSNLKNDPTVFANLGVKGFGIDGTTYGDADIVSRWNNDLSAIDLDIGMVYEEQKVINLTGLFYTGRKNDNLDFNLDLDGLELSILSPFLNKVAKRLQGQCVGTATIKGSLKAPDIQGMVKVDNGGCKINFLNTFYTFSPVITLTDGLITLSPFSLVDTLGNSALAMGTITHNHLKDMTLDLKLYPNNFLAMATTESNNTSFYGTAIADGTIEAYGPTDNLSLNIKALTRKGTSMTIPIGGNTIVKQHEFISFVDHTSEIVEEEEEEPVEVSHRKNNFNINLDLDVNNDAQVRIALPNGLGSIEGKGEGNIKLGLPSNSSMSLIGDYVIHSGSLALNIQDMLKRNFSLEPGSSISWTGDPVNGTINATGVYQTKASLSSLGLADSTNTASSNIKVDCLVRLKNKLLNPDISFGIRLPNASEDLQQAVFYVIDTTNQAEMLVQALYLMVFNTFNYGGGSSNGYYGLITNQLNDFISQLIDDDIDINVNYKPGSEMSNEEMTVAMRKQLFDDRLTIETNFGVIRPNSAYASNSTNIVGDFNLDYKITRDGRLSGQVFNRSNYNTTYYQYTYYKMAPYTQGIGLSYSKSFDTFRDLFKRRTNTFDLPNRPNIERPTADTSNNHDNEQPTE